MDKETIYRGRQNILRWKLLSNGRPFDTEDNNVTLVEIVIGTEVFSSVGNPLNIQYTNEYLSVELGTLDLSALTDGCHQGSIVVYATAFPQGKVWKELIFEIKPIVLPGS